ncbi:MAG: adenylate cyclase [Nocardioidaceae bacterium]|nr:adenylate cyclase [Nocardioidaceae bacterium]
MEGPGFTGSPTVRAAALTAALVAPLAGLALLLAQPRWDLHWEHHPTHFWLVLLTAAVSAVLAYSTGEAAVLRGDARVLHVSLAFLSSAGFLLLHALATPGVLIADSNPGFLLATPVGVCLGSLFALRSTVEVSGSRAVREVRLAKRARVVLVALMFLWALLSLTGLPPLDGPPQDAEALPTALAVPAVLLYAVSAVRYLQLWRRQRALMLLTVLSAFVLLAEAMLTIVFARSWHLSWWQWHVLLLAAYALVAYGARVSWRDERYGDLYLEQTRAGHRDISVLFADLQGFTPYSERHEPQEVAAMLHTYFEVAVPAVVAPYGGEVHQIIGDALMVIFNRRGDQPDHAQRAAGAGLAMQAATLPVADAHPGWPRFRVGVNSGDVSLSVLGTTGGRTLAVVGDVVNTASRIEGSAPAGGVAIGPATKERLTDARTTSLGPLTLKGKQDPVEAHLLLSLGGVHRG